MDDLASSSQAALAIVITVAGGLIAAGWRLAKGLAGSVVGRNFLRAMAEDLAAGADGRPRPTPDGDGDKMIRAIATGVHDELRPELDELHRGVEAVRTEQGAAFEREQARSRRIDALDARLAFVEGAVGRRQLQLPEHVDAPVPTGGVRR